LRRYVVFSVLRGVGLVLLVLVVVGGIIQLVGQFDDVGIANYGLAEALSYVLLNMPRTVFQSLPAAALIGTLMSLGNLAVHHELVVMRAAGISKLRVLSTVALAGFVLMVVMTLLGESLAPTLGAYAREMRAQAMLEDGALADSQSTWFKEGDVIFNLRRNAAVPGFSGGIYFFEINDRKSLRNIARADSADVDSDELWVLSNYGETSFWDERVDALKQTESIREYDLRSDLLGLSVVRHDLLDMPALQSYIAYLEENGLSANSYLIAYWSRIASVVAVLFMTLLAVPFVFGSMRSSASGARLVIGLVIGLGFYAFDQMFQNSGEVFEIDPLFVAWAPTAALGIATGIAVLRFR
jgi:lipopolysaccharide export system permease protein